MKKTIPVVYIATLTAKGHLNLDGLNFPNNVKVAKLPELLLSFQILFSAVEFFIYLLF